MAILDQFGRPIEKKSLDKEVARATTSGVRPALFDSVSNGITPERLAWILRSAGQGDIDAYLTLAEDMEERYLHYRSVLSTRKLAVSGAALSVEPADESPRAQEIADVCQEFVVGTSEFRDMLFDLLDALGKSFSVIELIWDTKTTPWTYKSFEWRDQRWFHFDRVAQRELRLKNPMNADGDLLPGGSFVCHVPKIKSGLPIRVGLARAAAIAFMASTYTLKDWLAYMEVFGMPLRLGKYDAERIKEPERMTLRSALANLGHDAAAMIPEGMDIQIIDVNRGSAGPLFSGLADYLDKQVSKGVLGQTMTTDDGSSRAQANVHDDVRQDIRKADAMGLMATVQRGVIRPWVQLNFGEDAPVCKFVISVDPPEDLQLFTTAVIPWIEKGGLKVGAGYIRDKFGIPDPVEDGEEEILGGKPEPVGLPRLPVPETAAQLPAVRLPQIVETEKLATDATGQWERVMSPYRKELAALADSCQTYEEFKTKLQGLLKKFDSNPFVALLAAQMCKARGVGDTE